jgi:hypothetical protein
VKEALPPPPLVPDFQTDLQTAKICGICGIDLVIECPCDEDGCSLRTHLDLCLRCDPANAIVPIRAKGIRVCDRVIRRLLLEMR